MAFLESLAILIFLSFLIFHYKPQKLKTIIDKMPLGMMPAILANLHQVHDFIVSNLNSSSGTFILKGPWFANIDLLFTTDPLDIQHLLSKNFANYPKGQKFRKIFDFFGDGMLNVDGHLWEFHRRTVVSFLRQPNFQSVFEAIIWDKVETGLLPVLESFSKTRMEMDLQDVFQRFTFDTICKLILDYDPQNMSLDFPCNLCEKSMSDIAEGVVYRHVVPPICWKLQQLFGMGNEKKLSEAYVAVDDFVYKCLARIQKESSKTGNENCGLVTSLIREFTNESGSFEDPKKFLRDAITSLMVAGKDTTSTTLTWFFYLLAKNPIVEEKILQEIHTFLEVKVDKWRWESKDLGKLVYLHGALCETLRLYPAVPFNHKTPLEPDVLPSGHQVSQNTEIILYFYGMGRMKKIWGEDCMEFKPERWILKEGGIKHEPFHKFPAFNGGPRACLGKDIGFTQMKIVASMIISHYRIELMEGHPVLPKASMILEMKHGLKARLTRRSEVNLRQTL